ncbi:MAG: AAA family ATPase [Candidatus Lokiarchaeota archaeon]|nr:AAA family ATPase [Candidatus Lokiarchaeota archaeon]MBD3338421.1 AAA family ATPase [Candidatus Lokiarchaeota archaeon]
MLKNPNNEFNIDRFYKKYLKGPKIFKNRNALESSYIPNELPHRDEEIKNVAEITACALVGDTPPSFLCYGTTGTGKTATIRYISQKLSQQNPEIQPHWVYINCNVVSTPYRILAHIYNSISGSEKIPPTGLPKDVIFKKLLGLMDNSLGDSICFLVLDEIDMISDKDYGNEILYYLIRLNENLDNCRTCLIGISNKLNFRQQLDPRVLSSLGEESVVFSSYNASELRDILNCRASVAFYDGVLKEDVVPLCAALAAKEHGDARKALQLLRKAGELAERAQNKRITTKHVNDAQNDIERDHVAEFIEGLPIQAQLILTAIFLLSKFGPDHIIISGDIYSTYAELSNKISGVKQLTERRISDYINELALSGIITTKIKSMGHYGRTKIINLEIDLKFMIGILSRIEKIQGILDYRPVLLQSNKVKVKNNVFKKLI